MMMRLPLWLVLAATLLAILVSRQLPDRAAIEEFVREAAPPAAHTGIDEGEGSEPTRRQVLESLAEASVVPERPSVAGYDRGCGRGQGCVFGPAWSDDTSAVDGHNGCDTRNDVLAQQLADVVYREGTHSCVVIQGTMVDPYTGKSIDFAKERATEIGIDHIYPLARAWDMGAWRWPLELRKQFANDPVHNLLAVSGRANSSKGDSGPGEWMPINRGYVCIYAARYLDAANVYDLPITAADAESLRAAAGMCPERPPKR